MYVIGYSVFLWNNDEGAQLLLITEAAAVNI